MRFLAIVVVVVGVLGCESKPKTPAKTPVASGSTTASGSATGSGSAAVAASDDCTKVMDKVAKMLSSKGYDMEPDEKAAAIASCRETPTDPSIKCVLAATDDAAIEACMTPAPKGEPIDQLDSVVENLRTLFFIHETFTDKKLPLTPSKPCCKFPNKKCPPETKPDAHWAVIEKSVDGKSQELVSKERNFQWRFESTSKKAVIEAIGDLDCDGKSVTYRRELEWRGDGNMHITVTDPPDGSD